MYSIWLTRDLGVPGLFAKCSWSVVCLFIRAHWRKHVKSSLIPVRFLLISVKHHGNQPQLPNFSNVSYIFLFLCCANIPEGITHLFYCSAVSLPGIAIRFLSRPFIFSFKTVFLYSLFVEF